MPKAPDKKPAAPAETEQASTPAAPPALAENDKPTLGSVEAADKATQEFAAAKPSAASAKLSAAELDAREAAEHAEAMADRAKREAKRAASTEPPPPATSLNAKRTYRVWPHGDLQRDGVTYKAGETLELPADVAATIPCLVASDE